MKSSRLLSILMLLQARGRTTAKALAAATEVSERTILRDIDELSAAGVPVWGERGAQGGFQLREGWSTRLTGMTEEEASALLLAGLPAAAMDLGLGGAAASARLKLIASVPTPWREQASRVAERLHIDPLDWYRSRDTPAFLREAAEAVWSTRRIDVQYRSWSGASRRTLEPLGLVLKGGAWYLVAREAAGKGTRSYRLASMLGLEVTGRAFRRPSGFDLASYWRESSAKFEAQLRPLSARVHASPRAMVWLSNTRHDHEVIRPPSGSGHRARGRWQEVLLPIESIEHGARELLSYGPEIEALEPPELRTEVRRMATRVLERLGHGKAP
jgi:predicted DNA-binding transcriptional regulator YafY